MNRKKWICTAAAITGLLLAVIAGLSIRHMKNSSYVSASELAGQKSGSVSEKLEENGNEDLAESSESKNGQPDGKQDQENGVGAEKNENGGNSSAGQNTDEEAAENDSSTGESENDSQESKTESEAEPTDQLVNLVFSGDILLSDHVMNAYKNGGIRSVLDSQFQSVIDESDIFMANEEFPFSTRGTPAEDKQFTFRAAPSLTFVFKELGIDIVTLANNHAMDYGTDALLDTCDTLDKAGIRRVGAGKNLDEAKAPVILEAQGEEEDSHLGDFIQDDNVPVPAEAAAQTLLKEQLDEVLDTLTEREQKVLRLRFGMNDGRARTLEEVGREFDVTRERIRQIEAKALRKLRHPSRSRKLRDYLD